MAPPGEERVPGSADTSPFGEEDYLDHVDGRPRTASVSAFLAARGSPDRAKASAHGPRAWCLQVKVGPYSSLRWKTTAASQTSATDAASDVVTAHTGDGIAAPAAKDAASPARPAGELMRTGSQIAAIDSRA